MVVEWTEVPGYKGCSWNPVSGCDRISEGCKYCWAKRVAETRLKGRFGYDEENPFKVTLHWDRLEEPRGWKKPRACFVVDMGDLFHDSVPYDFITSVFDSMICAPHHLFFVLTKRAKRMADYLIERNEWFVGPRLNHVWFGVTAENQERADERIPELLNIPSRNLFVSVEPLLKPLKLDRYLPYEGIHSEPALAWVIVGGESGKHCRIMMPDWVRYLRAECRLAKVPFYFKQWGGWPNQKEREKAVLDGETYKEFPRWR
jgi:protein gp37